MLTLLIGFEVPCWSASTWTWVWAFTWSWRASRPWTLCVSAWNCLPRGQSSFARRPSRSVRASRCVCRAYANFRLSTWSPDLTSTTFLPEPPLFGVNKCRWRDLCIVARLPKCCYLWPSISVGCVASLLRRKLNVAWSSLQHRLGIGD